MRISDWSSDGCSSDLVDAEHLIEAHRAFRRYSGRARRIGHGRCGDVTRRRTGTWVLLASEALEGKEGHASACIWQARCSDEAGTMVSSATPPLTDSRTDLHGSATRLLRTAVHHY